MLWLWCWLQSFFLYFRNLMNQGSCEKLLQSKQRFGAHQAPKCHNFSSSNSSWDGRKDTLFFRGILTMISSERQKFEKENSWVNVKSFDYDFKKETLVIVLNLWRNPRMKFNLFSLDVLAQQQRNTKITSLWCFEV